MAMPYESEKTGIVRLYWAGSCVQGGGAARSDVNVVEPRVGLLLGIRATVLHVRRGFGIPPSTTIGNSDAHGCAVVGASVGLGYSSHTLGQNACIALSHRTTRSDLPSLLGSVEALVAVGICALATLIALALSAFCASAMMPHTCVASMAESLSATCGIVFGAVTKSCSCSGAPPPRAVVLFAAFCPPHPVRATVMATIPRIRALAGGFTPSL